MEDRGLTHHGRVFRPAEVFHSFFALAAEGLVEMFTRNRLCVVLSVVAVLALSATCAQAAPITVANHSFQSPALLDGADQVSASPSMASPMGDALYIQNPTSAMFNNADGDGTPTGADGSQYVVMAGASGWGTGYLLLDYTIAAGETYTFTAAIGKRLDRKVYDAGDIVLAAESQGLAYTNLLAKTSFVAADLTAGEFKDFSVSYTVPSDSPYVGQKLAIWIGGGSSANGLQSMGIDNLRVNVTAVPEPATLSLLAAGLIGLLCYAWRKQK